MKLEINTSMSVCFQFHFLFFKLSDFINFPFYILSSN